MWFIFIHFIPLKEYRRRCRLEREVSFFLSDQEEEKVKGKVLIPNIERLEKVSTGNLRKKRKEKTTLFLV